MTQRRLTFHSDRATLFDRSLCRDVQVPRCASLWLRVCRLLSRLRSLWDLCVEGSSPSTGNRLAQRQSNRLFKGCGEPQIAQRRRVRLRRKRRSMRPAGRRCRKRQCVSSALEQPAGCNTAQVPRIGERLKRAPVQNSCGRVLLCLFEVVWLT